MTDPLRDLSAGGQFDLLGEKPLTTAAQAAEPEAYRVFKDGNQWCAVGPAFTNLQESPAGFADTPYLALERLTEAEAEERRKVWRAASPTPPTKDT